jgi:hypothetical protein
LWPYFIFFKSNELDLILQTYKDLGE